MKKIYSLVAISSLALSTVVAQQYDMEIRLASPAAGSNVAPGNITVTYEIENVGAADVAAQKVIWIANLIGQNNFSWDGTAGQVDGVQLPQALPPGQPIPSSVLSAGLFNNTPLVFNASSIAAVTPACVVIVGVDDDGSTLQAMATSGVDPNDANMNNNIACFNINPALASIVELSVTDAVDVKVLPETLEVTSTSIEPFNYIVFSMNGQTMTQGEVKGNTEISTSSYENGAYILHIYSNSEKKTVKFAVAR